MGRFLGRYVDEAVRAVGDEVSIHAYDGHGTQLGEDAMNEDLNGNGPQEPESANLTLAALAEAMGVDADFLLDLDVRNGVWGNDRRGCVDMSYFDTGGELVAIRKRLRLTGGGRFLWRRGDRPLPYGLQRLGDARASGRVILVPGESDAWVCWFAGVAALAIPEGTSWRPAWVGHLGGIADVAVWAAARNDDADLMGVVGSMPEDVRVITAPADANVLSELWLRVGRDAALFRARLDALIGAAPTAAALRQAEDERDAREALAAARPLLEAPDLLDRIAGAITDNGYAGDGTPALLAYLALTSRLLPRPMNLAFVAPSAAGKNRAVDAARSLVPDTAYHLVRAASPRALIYNDETYEHRVVIMAEADSLPDEGPAGSAIRSLASDNEMTYEVVESVGGAHVVRVIRKPGPTGLITTSTKPLPHQMDTRVLTVGIIDTPEQTRRVLLAEAARANGAATTADPTAFLALQRWLELAGVHDVHVPFADQLAALVPVEQVRMRRDFPQLLSAVQAISLLHQLQRERDADGRVVATLADYRMARNLLLPSFTEAASAGVSASVRETVEAVAALTTRAQNCGDEAKTGVAVTVTKTDVARHLGLSKDTVWRRIERCLELRYLTNLATRKSLPARLTLGDPLPDEQRALPEADELENSDPAKHDHEESIQRRPA